MEAQPGICRISGTSNFRRPRGTKRKQKPAKKSFEHYLTPLSGIRLLAQRGYLIVIEELEMKDESHPEFHDRRWKARVYDGRDRRKEKFVGQGEAPRKALAKESAALDFLIGFTLANDDLHLPTFRVSRLTKISPSVLNALERLCRKVKCGSPVYDDDTVYCKGREKHRVRVKVNGKSFTETAYELKYAKYGVAKQAFDSLSDIKFKLDDVICGGDCLAESERDDIFVGSEELHVVHTKNVAQLGRIFISEFDGISGGTSPASWYSGNSGRSWGSASESGSSTLSTAPKKIKLCVGFDEIPDSLEIIRKRMQERLNASL